ncbi:MAG: hypothetical protein LBI05_01455 [Planctomycetaceae bacterium]|jgi:hypothetical protein|nr:hypothetical protein [Planctomycetaceae bacterium]
MTTFHFQTHVSDCGAIIFPPLPENFHGENVVVNVDINDRPKGKSLLDEICGGWADDERTTEEIISDIYESRTIGRERDPL